MRKNNFDYELAKELSIVIENEYDDYRKEQELTKNYMKKWKSGKFKFAKAQKGVKNLIVTPRVQKYQNQFGMKVGNAEREAIAKSRLRAIMREIKESEKGVMS